jgi:hypothetical protein
MSMLEGSGGVASALQLTTDCKQAGQLVVQATRARRYPLLECRNHSADSSGQYLSLLVQAHATPRLHYTTDGVRSAFGKDGDYPQQAILVDTWASLDPIPERSIALISVALDQSAATMCQDGLEILPLGVFFRLIFLCQRVILRSEVADRFMHACNQGLQSYRDQAPVLAGVPIELTDAIMPWLFKYVHKPVLSTMFTEWLNSHECSLDEVEMDASPEQTLEIWMLSSIAPVQFSLSLLSDPSIAGDIETKLLDFLLASAKHGHSDTRNEIYTHGVRTMIRIVSSCVAQPSRAPVAVRALQLLKQSLQHRLVSVGGHVYQGCSDQLLPLVGAVASLLSTSLPASDDDFQMSTDGKQIVSSCIECLFLAVEGAPATSGTVIVAMRPGADGSVGSVHLSLYKLLQRVSRMEAYDGDILAAIANSVSLFISLLHKDGSYYYQHRSCQDHDNGFSGCLLIDAMNADDLTLINELLQFVPPTVGALVCTWLAASCQLRREHQDPTTVCSQSASIPLASVHTEVHMQLLNLALISSTDQTDGSLVSVSAVYCLEELYQVVGLSENSEEQALGEILQGWPSQVARVARDLLMNQISNSLVQEDPIPDTDRAKATENAELMAAGGASGGALPLSLYEVDVADSTLARVLGAVIARWPSIGPDLFEPKDTAVVVRHVAKADDLHARAAFRSLISAFIEHGMTAPAEKQESIACVHQIDQYLASQQQQQQQQQQQRTQGSGGISAVPVLVARQPVVQGVDIAVGHSCRLLCERRAQTVCG